VKGKAASINIIDLCDIDCDLIAKIRAFAAWITKGQKLNPGTSEFLSTLVLKKIQSKWR
jgi:hypothetical protein